MSIAAIPTPIILSSIYSLIALMLGHLGFLLYSGRSSYGARSISHLIDLRPLRDMRLGTLEHYCGTFARTTL